MAEIEGTFEQCAAAAMTAVGSGAVSDFTILEDVDLNKIAETAKKMASGYKEPGKYICLVLYILRPFSQQSQQFCSDLHLPKL